GVAADVAQLHATIELLAETASSATKLGDHSVDCPDSIPPDMHFHSLAVLKACLHAPKPPVWWGEALQRFNIQDIADFFQLPQAAPGSISSSSSSNSKGVAARGALSKLFRPAEAANQGSSLGGHRWLPNAHSTLSDHGLWLQQHSQLRSAASAAGLHVAPLPWGPEPGGGAPPHRGSVDPMAGYARQNAWNDPRSLSDRQLLEKLNRMTLNGGQDVHDDPTVIITLSGV
ncbi:hypothetical protein DUNSADRAFT_18616, partial [Dunaliella salina]